MRRRVYRRRNGVIAIRRAHPWRRAVVPGGAALVFALLVLAIASLPPDLLPIAPMGLGVGLWLLIRKLEPAAPLPSDPLVIPMRSVARRRHGTARRP